MNFNTATFLNASGHVTIGWDKKNDEEMRIMIEKKMKEGFRFFVLASRNKRIQIKEFADIGIAREVQVHDKDISNLLIEGVAQVVDEDTELESTGIIASNAQQVLDSPTLVTRAPAGG